MTGGATWIGNPDHLVYDKLMQHYVRGIVGGHIDAWNEREMLGYDSFIHPGIFPTPLTWLTAFLFDGPNLYATESKIAVVLLVLAGLAALAFLRTIGSGWFEAAVGAACYELCLLTIFKVSQQIDASFAEFAVLPLILIFVHNVRRERAVVFFFGLVLLMAAMLHFMSLQLVAYGFMLVGSYALWRSCSTAGTAPLFLVAGAVIVATVIASPRALGIAHSLQQYSRLAGSVDLSTFEGLYYFQNIRPHEILRWFDQTIFGIGSADATRLNNNINLSEGFLLATSAAVPLLLVLAMPRLHGRWGGLLLARVQDTAFWFWALMFTVLVVVWKPMGYLLYLLFLRQDFTHARILIAGLLPLCALIAIIMGQLNPNAKSIARLLGIIAGLVTAGVLEITVRRYSGTIPLESLGLFSEAPNPMAVRVDALMRIAWTLAVSAALVCLTLALRTPRRDFAGVTHAALGALIVGQAFLAADLQVNGPQTHTPDAPFKDGDMYMAEPGEFRIPSAHQIAELHARVGKDRVVLVCNPDVAGGFCAGHIPETWKIPAADGYYALAVPDRLRKLAWGKRAQLRTISFTSEQDLVWPLLGFLNVGTALIATNEFYKNFSSDGGPADIARLQMIENPAPVLPRAFLAAAADPVRDATDASAKIFDGDYPRDVQQRSFVEGLEAADIYDSAGDVTIAGTGDRLEFDVSATAGKRLLVVNDLFFPGWRAFVDGTEAPILAANVLMRAVLLPPDAKTVVMLYEPFVRGFWGRFLYAAGAVIFGVGLLVCARLQKSRSTPVL
jgi:hypothetical protein